MKPIPKSLLIHEVTIYREKSQDRWGNAKTDHGTVLKDIRMEPSSKIVRDKNGAEIQLAALLFYDCKNSKPRYFLFAFDDIVVFNGQKHQVKVIDPLYDNKKLHHYELGLIRRA